MDLERVELEDEQGAELGDPRRCPRHPGQVTSSPDGMFDAPCGACEMEADNYGYLDNLDENAVASFGPVDWSAEDLREEMR